MKHIAMRLANQGNANWHGAFLPLICLCLLVGLGSRAGAANHDGLQEDNAKAPQAAKTADEKNNGLQTIAVERYGVTVKVPAGWELVLSGRDDRAFVLVLPQDEGDRPAVAACEIAIAPESLEDYQSRIQHNAESLPPERKLVHNRILPPAKSESPPEAADGNTKPKLLDSQWEFTPPDGTTWYDLKIRRIEHGQLYTFVLMANQAHFEAYRQEFLDAIRNARFVAPDTGLQPLPGGYWMHREMHFGLKLPEGWKPSFPLSDKSPFFATGPAHEVLSDNLVVVATRPEKLELDRLMEQLPEEIKNLDAGAKVLRSVKVPQGDGEALESVIETQRGPFHITILQRRFEGKRRNYEINFTILTDEFEKLEAALKASADSFKEFPAAPSNNAA